MKSIFYAVMMALLITLFISSNCVTKAQESTNLQSRLDRIENGISEVRRDQLNYRVEKDLLKEAFSSNYQTINIVLAIVLGLFTVIGFLGIRDIGAIKKEYLAELERVNNLRRDLELNVKQIGEQQEKVKSDYLEIVKTNEEQSRRIKVLELQEKISSLFQAKNYQRALEYVAVALPLDPDNTILLDQKAMCFWRLNDLEEAILTYTELLKYDPDNKNAIANLLELFLLSNRITDYEDLYAKSKSWVDKRDNLKLTMYFNLLLKFQLGKEEELETLMKEYLEFLPAEKKKMIDWQFDDVLGFLDGRSEIKSKTLMKTFVSLLNGNISKEDAVKSFEANRASS